MANFKSVRYGSFILLMLLCLCMICACGGKSGKNSYIDSAIEENKSATDYYSAVPGTTGVVLVSGETIAYYEAEDGGYLAFTDTCYSYDPEAASFMPVACHLASLISENYVFYTEDGMTGKQ